MPGCISASSDPSSRPKCLTASDFLPPGRSPLAGTLLVQTQTVSPFADRRSSTVYWTSTL
jgi:hypothetical protein